MAAPRTVGNDATTRGEQALVAGDPLQTGIGPGPVCNPLFTSCGNCGKALAQFAEYSLGSAVFEPQSRSDFPHRLELSMGLDDIVNSAKDMLGGNADAVDGAIDAAADAAQEIAPDAADGVIEQAADAAKDMI